MVMPTQIPQASLHWLFSNQGLIISNCPVWILIEGTDVMWPGFGVSIIFCVIQRKNIFKLLPWFSLDPFCPFGPWLSRFSQIPIKFSVIHFNLSQAPVWKLWEIHLSLSRLPESGAVSFKVWFWHHLHQNHQVARLCLGHIEAESQGSRALKRAFEQAP